MLEIIQHTPIWVFILFFFLLYFGYQQSKDRNVSFKKAIILPIAMLFLSFYGVIAAFGFEFNNILFWGIGFILGVFLNILLKLPRNSEYIKVEKVFVVKGSFIPMFLIMSIFFTKYFVGVVSAKQLPILNELVFILIISGIYGLLSGIFFGRIFVLLNKKREGVKGSPFL